MFRRRFVLLWLALAPCACSPAGAEADAGAETGTIESGAIDGGVPCPGTPAPFQCMGIPTFQDPCPLYDASCDNGDWSCGSNGGRISLDAGCVLSCFFYGGVCVPDGGCDGPVYPGTCLAADSQCCRIPDCAAIGGACYDAGCQPSAVLASESSCGPGASCCAPQDGGTDAGGD